MIWIQTFYYTTYIILFILFANILFSSSENLPFEISVSISLKSDSLKKPTASSFVLSHRSTGLFAFYIMLFFTSPCESSPSKTPLVFIALHDIIASSALKFLIKFEANSPTTDRLLCFNTPGHRKHLRF